MLHFCDNWLFYYGIIIFNMRKCEKRDILYRQWGCSSPKSIVLFVHGLGGHSNNWEYMSDFLLKRGVSSYAIELKGFGKTETLKGHIDSLNTYVKDIRRLYNIIKKSRFFRYICRKIRVLMGKKFTGIYFAVNL